MNGYQRECYLDTWMALAEGNVQWVDHVKEDLQIAGLSYTWWRKSQDSADWRAAIKCLLHRTEV